jgi:hypothetical protein
MYFIQDTKPFENLRPFFIPAIYHRIIDGKKKVYQLSVVLDGSEIIVKKSPKAFTHTGFNKVIMGGVLRMEHLFEPEKIHLEVILHSTPLENDLSIQFELVNKTPFIIAGEEYIASIMVEYTYSKMDVVTYMPIIYRKICSNGMVSVMTKRFTEKVSADKIFEIGCEWSRCTFEKYNRKLNDYFTQMRNSDESSNSPEDFRINAIKQMERVLKIRMGEENSNSRNIMTDRDRARNQLGRYIEQLGMNQFAVWNAITDFASQERNLQDRNRLFLNIGKYLSNELEKSLATQNKKWSERITWDEALSKAK